MSEMEAKAKAAEFANDPDIQRLVEAGVMSWRDIIKNKSDPDLQDKAKLRGLVNKLEALEQRKKNAYKQQYARYQQLSVAAYNRPIQGTPFKIWQPARYANAQIPGTSPPVGAV